MCNLPHYSLLAVVIGTVATAQEGQHTLVNLSPPLYFTYSVIYKKYPCSLHPLRSFFDIHIYHGCG